MKITIVYGNERHGSTWQCAQIVKAELEKYESIEVSEFSLPSDMPHFCKGCFTCFYKGEDKCPHSGNIAPIVNAFKDSDLIVLTSPCYVMNVSGQMKAFLDHLGFMFMVHCPLEEMFFKTALTISTTAGAGANTANKTMRTSLRYWGVRKIFSLGFAVQSDGWKEVKEVKKKKIEHKIKKQAKKIYNAVKNIENISFPLFSKIFFNIMKMIVKSNTWNAYDKSYWQEKGWLNGKKPYKK